MRESKTRLFTSVPLYQKFQYNTNQLHTMDSWSFLIRCFQTNIYTLIQLVFKKRDKGFANFEHP